jgi:2-haloacid dehalogenase
MQTSHSDYTSAAGIRAVVFDFGGVLFDWSPQHLYQQLIPDAAERVHFLTHICSPQWNLRQDEGRTLADGTALLVQQYPQHEALIRAFYERWSEMLRGQLDDGVALLRKLHAQQVPLFGLTNWSHETFPYALANYDFLQLFRDIVVSGTEQCVKPDAVIYQLALRRYAQQLPDLQPSQLVFIDDLEQNVEAARRLGWQAIHHVDCDATVRQLQGLGLPV